MPEIRESLEDLKHQVMKEQGITRVGPDMTPREAGRIGGNMVKKLIERAKQLEMSND